jgi:hypothetical protein
MSCFANLSVPLQRNQTIVKIVLFLYLSEIMAGTKLFFNIAYTIYPRDLSVSVLYCLRNTTCLYSKDVASENEVPVFIIAFII